MFVTRSLSCSFCGKSAAEVAKLAAGPKVFICDVCAAEAHRIMSEPNVSAPLLHSLETSNTWRRIKAWLIGRGGSVKEAKSSRLPPQNRPLAMRGAP